MNIDNSIKSNFRTLSRGLMQPSYAVAFEAHKNLFEIGSSVIPLLKKKLLELDWLNSRYKELSCYVSGLYSLLHDLDEDEADRLSKILISNGCPEHIKAILMSVNQFSVKNYKRYHLRGIEIFEHKLLDIRYDISLYLDNWLGNVPKKDLLDISRLYVITREKINASGTYTPAINAIALLWDNPFKEKSLSFKFFALCIEKVLYHEIGHHKYRHKFGIDADQEREADSYAFTIMQKNHHLLYFVVKMLSVMGLKSTRNYYRWGL